jgi:hypothetical protein
LLCKFLEAISTGGETARLRKEESSRRSVLEKRRKDTRDECLVGDVVGKLESVSYGVGPPDQFDPCNFRSATSEF